MNFLTKKIITMKPGLNLFLLVSVLALACVAGFSQATDWKQIQFPKLHDFKPQQPKRIALPNGMVIFLQEDHELPLIDGTARIRGGSREEPAAKVGLVDIFGEAWRTGGTSEKTGDELDDFLEARAANVETGGFKADREFYSLYTGADASPDPATGVFRTLPVIETHWTDLAQGDFRNTGNPLDFAIDVDLAFLLEALEQVFNFLTLLGR